jgi:hypothetical protein
VSTLSAARRYYDDARTKLSAERERKSALYPRARPAYRPHIEREIDEVEQTIATLDLLWLMVTVETIYAD